MGLQEQLMSLPADERLALLKQLGGGVAAAAAKPAVDPTAAANFWVENAERLSTLVQDFKKVLIDARAAGVAKSGDVDGLVDVAERIGKPSSILVIAEGIKNRDPLAVSALVPPGSPGHKIVRKLVAVSMAMGGKL